MTIEHIAIWTNQLEALKDFYSQYFGATAGKKYHNPNKRFTSYFLSFSSGARLELMHKPDLAQANQQFSTGLAHFAISLGSTDAVDRLTETLKESGVSHLDGPRRTGDGYYESTFLDPDGNVIELTA
ncbi:VOC family protein [Tunicatimonas pelagia]|uniref:VOC family protein n=1 Tax=Tunicatimonas pelagia TaxID=931531 RepID=UPI002666FDE4|nr:VOC family protein [Tunicatimonas pelagia]WKN43417.1 VOC family protein [Tunicatimonas pelagia]